MSPRALLVAFVFAGCAIPAPGGAERDTAHYEIRTDAPEPALAGEVARAAEHAHLALAPLFGAEPGGTFPIVVFRDPIAFNRSLSPALRDRGFVGECGSQFALVYWPDDVRGKDTLAHELVHHFAAELLPELTYWKDEGLAKALAPKRGAGCVDWLAAVEGMNERELRSHVRQLEVLPEGGDYTLRCLVAAAVVRYGLETQGWPDLSGLVAWKPDVDGFVRWLRRRPRGGASRFPAVWDSQD